MSDKLLNMNFIDINNICEILHWARHKIHFVIVSNNKVVP